ncbi:FAD:protein FMN transferase [Bradyrhizobium sp. GCM10027634]|uniref:FAD:protein FMN transferase n=1 Tax=unclassified Bradyrhizobium TaxID=2631580 RepID=UPI00188C2E57|nr:MULTISPECIES: FAD:protein FMN transferase [unclassified Bradyrhizobium]MDN5005942.1 FAD:protein FMN transferase [Bradyrhizobium sp. WYCCWR 12677]QOZ42271.1 FAD:protein FMN transferase [Bradyrhizobium sp. CCBAU 53340]
MAIASDSIRRARPLLGTFVEIEVAGAPRSDMDGAIDAAFDAIAQVHRLMSFHEPDSDVSRLNRDAGLHPVSVHAWTFEVLATAIELHRRTKGLFDVTVAPTLQTLGLLPLLKDKPAPLAGFANAIELLPDHQVRFRSSDVMIDLGGIAKGFAVDRAVAALRDLNIPGGMVNAGGDLRAFGVEPRVVHIRDPRDPGRSVCRIDVADEALASTARRVELFDSREPGGSAVIDPATQRPAALVEGVTIRAPSCMIADALTKIVMIAGTDAGELLESCHAGALLISSDGDVQITSDWHHRVHLAA